MRKNDTLRKQYIDRKDIKLENARVAIIDSTHSGDILAKELRKRGSDVTLLDCYRTLKKAERDKLAEMDIQIKNRFEADYLDEDKFDLIISPVHCPYYNPLSFYSLTSRIISFHELVGFLLGTESNKKKKIIEITGLRGKTSTAFILYQILQEAELKVMLFSSLGVFYYHNRKEEVLFTDKKIHFGTPPSALWVMKEAERTGLEVDTFIFELSLGFTGFAGINMLTNLENEYDYRIAGNKISARLAKIYTTRLFDNNSNLKYLILSRSAYSTYFQNNHWRNEIKIICYNTFENEIKHEICDNIFIRASHYDNLLASAAAALCADISMESIKKSLREIKSVPGRMETIYRKKWAIVNNSNPVVDSKCLKDSLHSILKLKEAQNVTSLAVVFGGKERTTCSCFSYEDITEILSEFRNKVSKIYLTGEIGKKISDAGISSNFKEERNIVDELSRLIEKEDEGIILLVIREVLPTIFENLKASGLHELEEVIKC